MRFLFKEFRWLNLEGSSKSFYDLKRNIGGIFTFNFLKIFIIKLCHISKVLLSELAGCTENFKLFTKLDTQGVIHNDALLYYGVNKIDTVYITVYT